MEKIAIQTIATVIQYIESHLGEKLDLDTIADAVHYSKYYLHRMFTRVVGLSIHDYIQRRQLTEAAKLLVFSQKSIIEIALIAGYESQQAFATTFKAMYKQTPVAYRENETFYPLQLEYVLNTSPSSICADGENIVFVTPEDIRDWMAFVSLVVDGFPYLEEAEHLENLKRYISQKQALLMRDDKIIIGAVAFSRETGSIDFLGIHPQYRDHGIAKAFLNKLMQELLIGQQISITTFREGDKADTGQREACKKLGFAESELLTEFGYPTQRFVLRAHQEEITNE